MSALEDLLRASAVTYGRIGLYVANGEWSASVVHFNGPLAWQDGQGHSDPVDALRAALLEEERIMRDAATRYAAAPKAGPLPAADDDFEGLFG